MQVERRIGLHIMPRRCRLKPRIDCFSNPRQVEPILLLVILVS